MLVAVWPSAHKISMWKHVPVLDRIWRTKRVMPLVLLSATYTFRRPWRLTSDQQVSYPIVIDVPAILSSSPLRYNEVLLLTRLLARLRVIVHQPLLVR